MVKIISIFFSAVLIIYFIIPSNIITNNWITELLTAIILLIIILTFAIINLKNKEWKYFTINISAAICALILYYSNVPNRINEYFKSDKVLTATNNEGLGAINLILRKDSTYEYITFDFLAIQESNLGEYTIKNDTLFLKSDEIIYPSNKYHFTKDYLRYEDEWRSTYQFKIEQIDTNYFNMLIKD